MSIFEVDIVSEMCYDSIINTTSIFHPKNQYLFTFRKGADMFHQKGYEDCVPYLYTVHPGDFSYPSHWHIEIEFCYCFQGSISCMVSDIRYLLQEGDLLIINSCEGHEYKGISKDAMGLSLKMGHEFLGDEFYMLASGVASERVLHLQDTVLPMKYRCIREQLDILAEYHPKRDRNRWLVYSAMYRFIHEIRQLLEFEKNTVPLGLENKRKQVYSILDAVSYISQHYTEKITLEDIAAVQKYEISSFCRLFRTVMGVTPHSYLLQYRVKNAQKLLETTDLPINRIGEECGIPDAKSFSRIFKQYTEKTPSQYRTWARLQPDYTRQQR